MNIFCFLTDSICAYKRKDKFGLLEVYEELIKKREGYFFENVLSLFPSTLFSLLSIISGRFPYYLFPDFLEVPPQGFLFDNFFSVLRKNNFNIYSFPCFDIGYNWLKTILNPVIYPSEYKYGNQLGSIELFHIFLQYKSKIDFSKNNLVFVHFRAGDPKMDQAIRLFIDFLKKNNLWEDAFVAIFSDHGYLDRKKTFSLNPLHFDDISIFSLRPALFLKLPKNLSNSSYRTIKERVYLIDIFETILDYLDVHPHYKRQSVSFRRFLESNIDVSSGRLVRADAYLMFQPVQKTAIIKNNYKLDIINGKFFMKLIDINSENKIKINQNILLFNELKDFYFFTEKEAQFIIKEILEKLWVNTNLSKLENKTIIIPDQFPLFLVSFLREKLSKKNYLVPKIEKSDYLLIIYNRLTGYGIKKFLKRYNGKYNKLILINTKLEEIDFNCNNIGYLNFLKNQIKLKSKLLLKRPVNTFIWLFYYPLYLDLKLKRYYS